MDGLSLTGLSLSLQYVCIGIYRYEHVDGCEQVYVYLTLSLTQPASLSQMIKVGCVCVIYIRVGVVGELTMRVCIQVDMGVLFSASKVS